MVVMADPRGRAGGALARAAAMQPQLVRALTSYCGDRQVAEEIAQDTMLAACRQGAALEDVARLWGWLWRVAVNATHSHYRRAWREVLTEPDEPVQADSFADEISARLLLRELRDRERAAVWLRLFEQHTVAEAAEVLGCAPGTVKSLTSRAVARLRGSVAA